MSGVLIHSAKPIMPKPAPDFEKLVGAQGGPICAPAIRSRFERHDLRVTYEGDMDVRTNFIGSVFAALLIPFGRPLPFVPAGTYPASVKVSPDSKTGGVIWRREFMRPKGSTPIALKALSSSLLMAACWSVCAKAH